MKMNLLQTLVPLTLSLSAFAGTLAEDLKSIGVFPRIEKSFPERIKDNESIEDRYILHVKLGKLSEVQFKRLLNRYGNYSNIKFNPSREYELIDFLPPAMQALDGKTFQSSYHEVKTSNEEISFIFKNGISVASNCFNTSFEIIRSLQSRELAMNHRFYIPDRWDATDVIQNNAYGDYIAPSKIRPFDVLYYIAKSPMGMSTLQHTAIYLSDDLVFEKTDAMESDPYRISFVSDVKSKYLRLLPEMFDSYKLLNRRFLTKGKKLLPDLEKGITEIPFSSPEMVNKLPALVKKMRLSMGCETGLGGGCDMNFYDVKEIKFSINSKTGRAEAKGLKGLVPLSK